MRYQIQESLIRKLDQSEMWMLMHLIRDSVPETKCYQSNRQLCERLGWGIDKMQRVKQSLVEKGIINVIERKNDDGGQLSNAYEVITREISWSM
jgi:hypothetical protein